MRVINAATFDEHGHVTRARWCTGDGTENQMAGQGEMVSADEIIAALDRDEKVVTRCLIGGQWLPAETISIEIDADGKRHLLLTETEFNNKVDELPFAARQHRE